MTSPVWCGTRAETYVRFGQAETDAELAGGQVINLVAQSLFGWGLAPTLNRKHESSVLR